MKKTLVVALALLVMSCQGQPELQAEPLAEVGPFTDLRVRGVSLAERSPPPIIGGTLAWSDAAHTVVAADPDRDRVMLVDALTLHPLEVPLWPGALPTRVDTSDTQAFVVLRGTGEIATIALSGLPTLTHRWVCPAPRGVAWDARDARVWVVCQDGELVSFDPASLAAPSTLRLGIDDLRDVLVLDDALLVTRFRSAELIRLDREGHVLGRTTPPGAPNLSRVGGPNAGDFVPGVAWRAVLAGPYVVVSHQRTVSGVIEIAPPTEVPSAEAVGAYGGSVGGSGRPQATCGSAVVQSVLTRFDATTLEVQESILLSGGALPIDVAVAADRTFAAVVNGGIQRVQPEVVTVSRVLLGRADPSCIPTPFPSSPAAENLPGTIAVILPPTGRVIALSRDPATLTIDGTVIDLGGVSVFDVGHSLFHADAGHGVACASCHPEAGDDGRTWQFSDTGVRRTLSLPAGLLSTAPFHWSGELTSMGDLMHEVFSRRMGGGTIDARHVDEVAGWIDSRPMEPTRAPDDAARRGRALFEGPAECSTCHSGAMLTNATTVDVGTGGAFQVPTLLGVAHRLPVMHTGCATTLRARFTTSCGGAQHGSQTLHEDEIDDLVAYLETL